jgi:hypothetical protein
MQEWYLMVYSVTVTMEAANNQNIQKQMKSKKEQASKEHSKLNNTGTLNLSMRQDIVQKVANYQSMKMHK